MQGVPELRTVDSSIVPLAYHWYEMGVLCKELHVLPSCGGLKDQDPRDISKLVIVLNALNKHEESSVKQS